MDNTRYKGTYRAKDTGDVVTVDDVNNAKRRRRIRVHVIYAEGVDVWLSLSSFLEKYKKSPETQF